MSHLIEKSVSYMHNHYHQTSSHHPNIHNHFLPHSNGAPCQWPNNVSTIEPYYNDQRISTNNQQHSYYHPHSPPPEYSNNLGTTPVFEPSIVNKREEINSCTTINGDQISDQRSEDESLDTDQSQSPKNDETKSNSGLDLNSSQQLNEMERECANCNTRSTPLWRRYGPSNFLCNACGLYQRVNGNHRPLVRNIRRVASTTKRTGKQTESAYLHTKMNMHLVF